MLWKRQDGYSFTLRQVNPTTGEATTKPVSCMELYAYHLMVRKDDFKMPLRFKNVSSQYMVDMYVKIESERSGFIH